MSTWVSGSLTAKLLWSKDGSVDPAVVRGRITFLPGEISPRACKGDGVGRSEKSAEAVVVFFLTKGRTIESVIGHVDARNRKSDACQTGLGGADVLQAAATNTGEHAPEYQYYPDQWFEPYSNRRRTVGFDRYEALGIARGDLDAREQQTLRNYLFFDAPVGLLISLGRRLNTGSYMDLGMFIENIMLAARGQGIHTCAQAAFAWYYQIVRKHLAQPDNHILVCGIAMDHEDQTAPQNSLVTDREPIAGFTTFHGFDQ